MTYLRIGSIILRSGATSVAFLLNPKWDKNGLAPVPAPPPLKSPRSPLFAVILRNAMRLRRISKIPDAADPAQSLCDSQDDHGREGFTLIEMSIVLVIIGLIVGGVLAGRDLVKAAEVRATITQVERFNSAVNTFFGKYSALPGDLNAQVASTFGFSPRGSYAGEGDGNGIIESNHGNSAGQNTGLTEVVGESNLFWVDLTTANGLNLNLIDGGFSTASATVTPSATVTNIAAYLPAAKIGRGNYFYVWSGFTGTGSKGINYYGLSAVTAIPQYSPLTSTPALTVAEAYNIDKKIDDGFPQSGKVEAQYVVGGTGIAWAAGGGATGGVQPNAVSPSSTTCYDNGGVASSTAFVYSVTQNGGSGVNCALSFTLQGGD